MAFKLKSGNASSFKDMGSSPAKQKPGGIKGEAIDHWNKYRAKAIKTHDAAINKLSTDPKTRNLPAKEFDALLDKTSKKYSKPLQNIKKAGLKGLKKAGKFLGGKTLGVAGMMMGTTSKADQPKSKKSEGQQIKDLLTKHKLKGGKN
jgi:hypothetical protein